MSFADWTKRLVIPAVLDIPVRSSPFKSPLKMRSLSVCLLASGSKGNATYISDGRTSLLVDAGLSGLEIERRLTTRGLCPKAIDAIIVSHEHADHIQGVGVLSRRYNIPVYITKKTDCAAGNQLGKVDSIVHFECGKLFSIQTLAVRPFSLSHDAEDPSGFVFFGNGMKLGMATDLGAVTGVVKAHLQGCNGLIIEANHDPGMLIEGPYPWPLKQRIRGRTGHLSNEESRELLKELVHERLTHVILAHLSENNNTPEKALNCVGEALPDSGIRLEVARQDCSSELFVLE